MLVGIRHHQRVGAITLSPDVENPKANGQCDEGGNGARHQTLRTSLVPNNPEGRNNKMMIIKMKGVRRQKS